MSKFKITNNKEEAKKKLLLQEFQKTAHQITPSSGIRGLRNNFGIWFSLNMTILMQRIGYNKRKIFKLKEREIIILNIGCGDFTDNNYINVDLFPSIGILRQIILGQKKFNYDLLLNLPYYDGNLANFANGIVLSHVLEHISPTLAITSLRNCFEYLKPGGHIRVSVPHLNAYNHACMPTCQGVQNRNLAKNRLIYLWQHRFMYDAELPKVLMEEVGFQAVKEVAFRQGILHESDLSSHQPESIYLTAGKPF